MEKFDDGKDIDYSKYVSNDGYYIIPVEWSIWSTVKIKADNLQQALDCFKNYTEDCVDAAPIGKGQYIRDSYKIGDPDPGDSMIDVQIYYEHIGEVDMRALHNLKITNIRWNTNYEDVEQKIKFEMSEAEIAEILGIPLNTYHDMTANQKKEYLLKCMNNNGQYNHSLAAKILDLPEEIDDYLGMVSDDPEEGFCENIDFLKDEFKKDAPWYYGFEVLSFDVEIKEIKNNK